MSETKHTPGPWIVQEGPNDSRAFDVYAGTWKVHHGAWGREADAHLISAAPELLGALRDALAVLGGFDMTKASLVTALERGRAAIAKAEGR